MLLFESCKMSLFECCMFWIGVVFSGLVILGVLLSMFGIVWQSFIYPYFYKIVKDEERKNGHS